MSLRRRPGAVPASRNRITTRTTASTAVADTTSMTADGSSSRQAYGEDDMQDDAHHSDSAVSGLTSLSGDDDFERRMIEKAREDRRRAHGREQQAFRKARTHPRVGLTMANLERNEARTTATAANILSPRSSSGSTRSDPAIHAPAGWGRKGRTSRDWMRAITRGYQGEQDDVRDQDAVDAPDSPLSHKSFQQDLAGAEGAARQDSTGELDLTFDMNEASMLVSTPYLPRTTWQPPARLQPDREQKTDKEKENSPIVVSRKSVETLGVVARDVVASVERPPTRPFASRRSDSQDLLRLLARASNTPSPKATARPQSQAYSHPRSDPYLRPHLHSHPQAEHAAATHVPATSTPHDQPTPDVPATSSAPPPPPPPLPPPPDVDATPIPTAQPVRHPTTPHVMGGWVDTPGPRTAHQPVHARPPRSQSPEQDSPAEPPPPESAKPLAVQEQIKVEQTKVDQIKVEPTDVEQVKVEQTAADQAATEQPQEPTPRSVPRPQLPSSALHALVQEARVHHDYGDDTMHSLEELLGPVSDDGVEEDTLQGLALPTSAPRSEAERERHAETVHIHRLREHLRATETNVRDVGRGMRRLETLMEHSQTGKPGEKVVIVRNITTEFSPWLWFRSFFWDERIKTQRQAENGLLKIWGGVTLFGILLTLSFIYWASETVACEIYCHPEYASYSPYPFAVNIHAPKRGRVIPTLLYRALFKSWSTPILTPIASLLSCIGSALWSLGSGISANALRRASYEPAAADMGYAGAAHTHASRMQQEEEHEEDSWEWSMTEDEVLRR